MRDQPRSPPPPPPPLLQEHDLPDRRQLHPALELLTLRLLPPHRKKPNPGEAAAAVGEAMEYDFKTDAMPGISGRYRTNGGFFHEKEIYLNQLQGPNGPFDIFLYMFFSIFL